MRKTKKERRGERVISSRRGRERASTRNRETGSERASDGGLVWFGLVWFIVY